MTQYYLDTRGYKNIYGYPALFAYYTKIDSRRKKIRKIKKLLDGYKYS